MMAAGQPLHLFQQPQQHVGGQAALVGLVHHDDAEVWEEEFGVEVGPRRRILLTWCISHHHTATHRPHNIPPAFSPQKIIHHLAPAHGLHPSPLSRMPHPLFTPVL